MGEKAFDIKRTFVGLYQGEKRDRRAFVHFLHFFFASSQEKKKCHAGMFRKEDEAKEKEERVQKEGERWKVSEWAAVLRSKGRST